MSGEANTTIDHDQIRQWAEQRGGQPAEVAATADENDPGILRIKFPDYGSDEGLKEISWEEFFQKFEDKGLAFLYQDTLKDGEPSRFFKFVFRESG